MIQVQERVEEAQTAIAIHVICLYGNTTVNPIDVYTYMYYKNRYLLNDENIKPKMK